MYDGDAYGLWQVVVFNSMVFLIFAFSFFRPRTRRDWRTFGAFSAFVIGLFTEMYGFPLTIYLFSGWLTSHFPEVDWYSHDAGHLFQTILGYQGLTHLGLLHIISDLLILGGFVLLAASWRVLFKAQLNRQLAVTGPYARIRHPQYAAFILIMVGFLIQWPTLPTLLMFPILFAMYLRLALREEKDLHAEFAEQYARYAEKTPRFLPWFRRSGGPGPMEHFGFQGPNFS